jgi:hypothetical protein
VIRKNVDKLNFKGERLLWSRASKLSWILSSSLRELMVISLSEESVTARDLNGGLLDDYP